MASLFGTPKFQALDSSGTPIAGAKLFFYETNTSNPKNTYHDIFLNDAHTNPVVADAFGLFDVIWLDTATGNYRVTLTTSGNVAQWTVDNVVSFPTFLTQLRGSGSGEGGNALIPAYNGGVINVATHTSGSTGYPDGEQYGVFLQVDRADNSTGSSQGSFRIYSKAYPDNALYFAKWNFGTQVWDYSRILSEKEIPAAGTGNIRHFLPNVLFQETGVSIVGAFKIALPFSWNNTMLWLRISGYDYSTKGPWEILVGGYIYQPTTTWVNFGAYISAGSPVFTSVKFGHDGSKCFIQLGAITDTHQYPMVGLVEVMAGHNGFNADWFNGWVITRITSEAGFTYTGTINPLT